MRSHKPRQRVATWKANLESLEPRRLLATYVVDSWIDENDGNHGTGDFSLREAIAAAAANPGADTINVKLYILSHDFVLSQGPLLIQSDLTIDASVPSSSGTHLTIDAAGASGAFVVAGGVTVSLTGFEITGGQANIGGGLRISKTTSVTPQVTLTRMKFAENHANIDGGAIYSDQANLKIMQTRIINNTADDDGGGVFAVGGPLVVHNSQISNNKADSSGGGIVCSGPSGRVDPDVPAMYFSNSLISLNQAGDDGGGIAVLRNAARFVNCTIVSNRADTSGTSVLDGGGIRTDNSDGSTTLNNTIVAGNRRGTGTGVLNDFEGNVQSRSYYNLLGSPNSSGGLTNGFNHNKVGKNGGTLPLDEILDLGFVSYELALNSPAHDAGSNALALDYRGGPLKTDQRGGASKRSLDGPDSNSVATVDIGSVEMKLLGLEFENGVNSVASYTENGNPVRILPYILQVSSHLLVGDYFGITFPTVTITVSVTANGAGGDRLTVLHEGDGPGQIEVQGTTILYQDVVVGSFTPSTGVPPLEITLNNVQRDRIEHVLRRLAFSTVGNNPSAATRTVLVQMSPFPGQAPSSDTITVNVVPVNDAPTLDNSLSPALDSIEEDATDPAGTFVSELLADAVTDPDNLLQGMAVTAASNFHGDWQFSLDGGTTWQAMGEPTSSRARLLPSDAVARVRFLPNANFDGTVQLYYRAWDRTQGTAGDTLPIAGNSGGTGPLSRDAEHAPLTVTPVNDEPVLALSGTVDYDLDADAITLAPNAVVTDIDNPNLVGGRLRVRITDGASSSNHLLIGAGFTVDARNNVLQGTTIMGRLAASGEGTNELIVTFNSAAKREVVQQLVRAITFKTSGGSAGKRIVLFTVSDGDGGLSNEATKTVNVT
jgi:hypothetical protein